MYSNEDVFALVKPEITITPEYRLYYNDAGEITHCSMIEHAEGTYVVVDRPTYDNYFRYRVVNGELKKIESDAQHRVKLHKANTGYAVVAGHAGLILEPGETYTEIEYYDRTDY